jgi:ArsR family transcriptional regulator
VKQLSNKVADPQLGSRLEQLLSPRMFRALGNETRIGFLVTLSNATGALTVGDLEQSSSVDMSVVSRHLAILRDAGFLLSRKIGKEVWYSIRTREVAQMLRDLADCLEHRCSGGSAGH